MKAQNLQVFFRLVMSLAFLFLCSVGTFAAHSAYTTKDEPYKVQKFTINGNAELYVETSGGSINVEGGNGNEVEVAVYVRSNRWGLSKIETMMEEDYKLTIEKHGDRVEAIAKRISSGWMNNGLSISFVVKVPTTTTCELKTSGGSIELSKVKGSEQRLNTSGGSITMRAISGDIDAHTSGGGINIDHTDGNVHARTSGGSIRVSGAAGLVDVNTSGGGIHLDDVSGKIIAQTSGGGIDADIRQLTNELTLKTSGGSIHARIPSGLGLDLNLRGNHVNTQLENFSGESKSDKIVGSINGGGIPVNMSTSGGSVTLDYD